MHQNKQQILKRYLQDTLEEIKVFLPHYCQHYCAVKLGQGNEKQLIRDKKLMALVPQEVKDWAEYFCDCDIQSNGLGHQSQLYCDQMVCLIAYKGNLMLTRTKMSFPRRIASLMIKRIYRYCHERSKQLEKRTESTSVLEDYLWNLAYLASVARRKGFFELPNESFANVDFNEDGAYWLLGNCLYPLVQGIYPEAASFEKRIKQFCQSWHELSDWSESEHRMGNLVEKFLLAFLKQEEKNFFYHEAKLLPPYHCRDFYLFLDRVLP